MKKGAAPEKTVKELLMSELNVVSNLVSKKRYMSYNLVGHTKMISCMDIKDGLLVTGGYDSAVKVWDIKKKKGYSFDHFKGHMNQVTKVLVWD